MPERWREALDALGGVQPDQSEIRRRVSSGRRLRPGGEPGGGRRAVAAAVAFATAAASFAFVWYAFRDRPVDTPMASGPNPAEVCDVPAYDPDIAVLYGNEPGVEYPLSVLESPGEPADDIQGPATDALREYIASPAAKYAPHDGWRAVAETDDAVTFASPHESLGAPEWWVVGFELRDGQWKRVQEETAEQRETVAQRGHGLHLEWSGDLVLEDGQWESTLQLVNERDSTWKDLYWGEHSGLMHVFDRETGTEVGRRVSQEGSPWVDYDIQPGASATVPVTLGGTATSLEPGTYDVIACVSGLGLASPAGTLRIVDGPATVPNITVLTLPISSVGMQALGGGTLTVHNGCLATGYDAGKPQYVVWPEGYSLVERSGSTVLIDAVGSEIAELGQEVSLGGGNVHLDHIEGRVIGGIPDECRTGGEGYFVTSGLA